MTEHAASFRTDPTPSTAPVPARRRRLAAVASGTPISAPTTQGDIADELRLLGVARGDTVLVHSSLRSMGFVVGGAQAVVGALLDAVGPRGTVVVPTHSGAWSEPSHWSGDLPESWLSTIREHTPAFHPRLTPTQGMGAVVECMRRWPGFARSWHPRVSFGAIGPRAAEILDDHALASGFGERSPVGRLYEVGASILLIGVPHSNSSALHLAEHRAHWPGKRWIDQGAAITVDGETRWVTWRELDHDPSDFHRIGAAIEDARLETVGRIGTAESRLMPLRDVVDLATTWIAEYRTPPPADPTQ